MIKIRYQHPIINDIKAKMHENRINQIIIFSKIIFMQIVIDVITTILANNIREQPIVRKF